MSFVAGGFVFQQTIESIPRSSRSRVRPRPACCWRRRANAATPGLLDGYGFNQFVDYGNTSAAVFGQVDLALTDRLRLLPGLRFNYDQKDVDFDQQVYGGLQTTNPALIALQQSILAPQAYRADVDDTNLSGQITAAYALSKRVNAYATYATGFKSVGLNLNGVPTDASNRPVISAATVKPEDVRNIEVGIKTELLRGLTANLTAYDTDIEDFQTQVTNASVGVLRGYLANAERVRVRGVELDATARLHRNVSLYGAVAYTDGRYVTFRDAPPPLEDTGGPQSKDISGSLLPGISKWAVSVGGEYAPRALAVRTGRARLRGRRCQLSLVVLVERQLLALPGRRRLLRAQRADRFPRRRRLDGLRLVAQPARQGLLRAADGGAGQHRPLCRPAGRRTNGRDHAEGCAEVAITNRARSPERDGGHFNPSTTNSSERTRT